MEFGFFLYFFMIFRDKISINMFIEKYIYLMIIFFLGFLRYYFVFELYV